MRKIGTRRGQNTPYDDKFYRAQISGSYNSAKKYAELVFKIIRPVTVVDVGCGRGCWLKAFKEAGANRVVGYDGSWNSQENMLEDYITFYPCDLNQPIPPPPEATYDLAMSLEVAEHLLPSSARTFVMSLTRLADAVLFGAAYTGQGGTDHINEQPHTFWANLFIAEGFYPFDIFRPLLWGDSDVEFWYRQNTFLYVRKGSGIYERITSNGVSELQSLAFMNCIHPALFEAKVVNPGLRASTKNVVRALGPALKRRIGRLAGHS